MYNNTYNTEMMEKSAVGNLFLMGVKVNEVDRETLKFLKSVKPAGVVLYGAKYDSPSDLKKWIEDFKKAVDPDMIVAVDHEGGSVQRFRNGFTIIPPAEVIGDYLEKTGDIRTVYEIGKIMALELRAVGVNMNLAPVLDLKYEKNYIRDRAFSNKITVVEEAGLALIAGMQDHKLIACGKHFPGHGPAKDDSHKKLPVVHKDEKSLMTEDMRPFIHTIKNGLKVIMTAHVAYPEIDKKPASLSYKLITSILKNKLSFGGVILSDDILMKAITEHYAPEEASVEAIKAGNDIVIVSENPEIQEKCVVRMEKGIMNKEIKPERFLDALISIRALRMKMKSYREEVDINMVGCDAHRRFIEENFKNV